MCFSNSIFSSVFFGTRTIILTFNVGAESAQIQLKLDEDLEPGIYNSSIDARGDLFLGYEGYSSNGNDQFEITFHDKFCKVIEGTYSFTPTNVDLSGETVEITDVNL